MIGIGTENINDRSIMLPLMDELSRRRLEWVELPFGWDDNPEMMDLVSGMGRGDALIVTNQYWYRWCDQELAARGRPPRKGRVFSAWTMHEFVSSKLSMGTHLGLVDAVCVPNDYVLSYLQNEGTERLAPEVEIWGTGYLQLDTLWKALHWTQVLQTGDILVCPTSNFAFSDGLDWMQGIPDLSRGDYTLVVKAHRGAEEAYYQELGNRPQGLFRGRGVVFRDRWEDMCAILPQYRIHVGDVGSAMFLQLLTDRPCMVYDSYRWWEDTDNFDTKDAAFRFRKAFYTFSSAEQFDLLVRVLLRGDDPLRDERRALVTEFTRFRGRQLFDGKVAARIADLLQEKVQ